LASVNDFKEIKGSTELTFTLNGVSHVYTTYELERAFKDGDQDGKLPGVAALLRYFCIDVGEVTRKKERGRPVKDKGPGKSVRVASGYSSSW
jgi:hypothetical protein